MKMGCGQFLRDFRRDFRLKKTLAHRKAVLARKEKAAEKRLKVELDAMKIDRSPFKRSSHVHLLALISQVQAKGMMRLYTKSELHKLCSAYGVHYQTKWNKAKIVNELMSKVENCTEIPCHEVLSSSPRKRFLLLKAPYIDFRFCEFDAYRMNRAGSSNCQ
jgi:hypothetical protein